MRRGADHIEFGRMSGIITGKSDLFCSHRDIQAVLMPHFVCDAVACDCTWFTDVEDSDFPAFQEIMCAEVFPAVNALINRNCFIDRHAAQGYHPIDMRINRCDFIGCKQIRNQKLIPNFIRGITLEVPLVSRITNIHCYVLLFLSVPIITHFLQLVYKFLLFFLIFFISG